MSKIFIPVAVALFLLCSAAGAGAPEEFYVPCMGPSIHVYDPGEGQAGPWYINDHCVVRGPDGRYHLFGITHAKQFIPPPWAEHDFAHASTDTILKPGWRGHERVLKIDKSLGETHVWAPHAIENDGIYYMFYAAGGGHWESMINLATSKDLFDWKRHPDNPMFRDFYDARDPMVTRHGDEYVMYYTKTFSRDDHRSTVAVRRSRDLVNWSEPEFALVLSGDPLAINSGHTESPYYFQYNGVHYLCICNPFYHYRLSRIFASDDPLHFDEANEVTAFIAHCPEVLEFDGQWSATHAGWFYNGVYAAPISWIKARRFEPQSVFINAGETREYLSAQRHAEAAGAHMFRLAPLTKSLKIKSDGYARYSVPLPDGLEKAQLFVCVKGDYRITVNSKDISAAKDPSSSEALDLYWIEDSACPLQDELLIEIRPGSSGPCRINWMRIYFIE